MGLLDKAKQLSSEIPANDNTFVVADWAATPVTREVFGRTRPPVKSSPDLTRILALPRRPPVDLENDKARCRALIELMGERLGWRNDNCDCEKLGRKCIRELKAVQAWTLFEAGIVGGVAGAIGVGGGKSGIDLLLPMVVPGCRRAVVLVPPTLQTQLRNDHLLWSQHFKVPSLVVGNDTSLIYPGRPVLHVIAYSRFSRAKSTALLEQLDPDLIISDEGHRLRYRETATTGRVLRHFVAQPKTRFAVQSGTFTKKSIQEYAHLLALALRAKSPLPLHPPVVEEWSCAIDPPLTGNTFPAPRGALAQLGSPDETLYAAFQRRMKETQGFIATKESDVAASIYISERVAPPIPAALRQHLTTLRSAEVRPDGEELVDAIQVARCARELACGFYYRWRYPHGASDGKTKPKECSCKTGEKKLCEWCQMTILKWFSVRKAYNKELRQRLKDATEHMDSPLLCWKAAERFHTGYEGDLPVWPSETWPEWNQWHKRIAHETEAVWVDDYLAKDAAEWAKENKGIVWYAHEAFGRRVAELSGLPLHGGGPNAGDRIAKETGKTSIIVSIQSHGTGRDGLQRLYSTQLIANPPSSGDQWEQLLGRTHRDGQIADEVEAEVYRHTPEMCDALDSAIAQSAYIEGTMGTSQKLLKCTFGFNVWRPSR